MYILIWFCLFYQFCSTYGNFTKIPVDGVVGNIADSLLALLYKNNGTNFKKLQEKLSKVDSYVVDKDKYSELIQKHVRINDLNETNFYEALRSKEHFLLGNDTKSLYLKLKEKMTRDDLLRILKRRGNEAMKKSVRRALAPAISRRNQRKLNELIDKYLGEAPNDNHSFNDSMIISKTWDPQPELEERQAYYHPNGRRLFAGERTTVRYYPFVVSIHIMGRFWCGGSIYWQDLIITSAACLQLIHNNRFFRENPRVLTVRVGSNHSRIGGETIDALEVYFHPAYNPRTLKNNIALIRLQRRIRFSYHRVPKTIEISTYPYGQATTEVLLLGWGVTKTSQKLAYEPIYLQRKMLPVYPKKFCQEIYGEKFITDTMFCAGTVSTGEGACDHDAGGPAVMNGVLVGIISFGPTICGFPDAPTVFTLVGAYADWIQKINDSMPEYYRGRYRTSTSTVDPFIEYFQTTNVQPIPKFVATVSQNMLRDKTHPQTKKNMEKTTTAVATNPSLHPEPENAPATSPKPRAKDDDFVITPRMYQRGRNDDSFIDFISE